MALAQLYKHHHKRGNAVSLCLHFFFIFCQKFWIGLNDRQTEGKFEWTDGSSVDYTKWGYDYDNRRRQPDNRGGDEDCVYMYMTNTWFDSACDQELAFMCEKKKP